MATFTRSAGLGILAVGLATALSLSSCIVPFPRAAESTQTSQGSTSSSAAGSAAPSAQATDPGTTTPGTSGGGVAGGFGSMSEACLAVSASMVSVAILPLAGLLGGKSEDVDKAREELSKLQAQVPDELKPHFEKLRAFTEAAGSDFSKYGTGEFEALMKPIEEWLNKNCS